MTIYCRFCVCALQTKSSILCSLCIQSTTECQGQPYAMMFLTCLEIFICRFGFCGFIFDRPNYIHRVNKSKNGKQKNFRSKLLQYLVIISYNCYNIINLLLCICVYMYIYICVFICMCTPYIYIYNTYVYVYDLSLFKLSSVKWESYIISKKKRSHKVCHTYSHGKNRRMNVFVKLSHYL